MAKLQTAIAEPGPDPRPLDYYIVPLPLHFQTLKSLIKLLNKLGTMDRPRRYKGNFSSHYLLLLESPFASPLIPKTRFYALFLLLCSTYILIH